MKDQAITVMALAVTLLAASCATPTTQYSHSLVRETNGHQLEECTIYLMRKNTFQAGGVPMLAFDRDQPIGSYGSNEYLRWTRPPGKVDLRVVGIRGGALKQVMTEGKSANEIIALYGLLNPDNTPVLGRVSFDARAGHSYYILQTTDVPFLGSGRNVTISLESAPETEGQRYLKGRKPPRN